MRAFIVAPMSREAGAIGRDAFVCPRAADLPASIVEKTSSGTAAVLIAGICGGLDPSLAPGALILGRKLVAESGGELTPNAALFNAVQRALRAHHATFVSSTLLTVTRPMQAPDAKTDAWNTHGAAGVDMETYEIAAALEAHGIPWLAIRSVLDPAASTLPAAAAAWSNEGDERAIGRAALRTPREWPAYARLALQLRTSLRTLSRAVPVAIDAIAQLDDVRAPEPRREGAAELPIIAIS